MKKIDIPCQELRALYEEKQLTFNEIALLYSCSATFIHRRMKLCGIESRPTGGAILEYSKKDFAGSLRDKAYLIGLRLGDLHVEKGNWAIRVRCTSTHQEQIDLVRELFFEYGGVWVSRSIGKRGVGITAHLNLSFEFLLPKKDEVEDWILNKKDCFAAFFAGYTDAEGSFIVSGRRAYFKIDSGDKNILYQLQSKLFDIGIEYPEPSLIRPAGTWIKQFQLSSKTDLWRLSTERKETLLKTCLLLSPYLRHQKRIRDMEAVKSNVMSRIIN